MPRSLCYFICVIEIKTCSNWYLCSQSYLHPCTWGQANVFVFNLMELPQTRARTIDIQLLFIDFNNVIPTDVLLLILRSKHIFFIYGRWIKVYRVSSRSWEHRVGEGGGSSKFDGGGLSQYMGGGLNAVEKYLWRSSFGSKFVGFKPASQQID